MPQHEATDSWERKKYEDDLTDFFFKTANTLREAQIMPTLENINKAFAAVNEFSMLPIYSKTLVSYENNIKPVLKDMTLILFGMADNRDVIMACRKYGVTIKSERGKKTLVNGQKIINELNQVMFLVKQYAYKDGFFAKKPMEQKLGTGAIGRILEM